METKTGIILGIAMFYVIVFTLLGFYGPTYNDVKDVPRIDTLNATSISIAAPEEDTSSNAFGWFNVIVNIINFIIRLIIGLINIFLYVINFLISIITVVKILPLALNTVIFVPLVITVGWIIITFYSE